MNERGTSQNTQTSSQSKVQQPQRPVAERQDQATVDEGNQHDSLQKNRGGMIDDSEFHYEHMEIHFNDEDEDEEMEEEPLNKLRFHSLKLNTTTYVPTQRFYNIISTTMVHQDKNCPSDDPNAERNLYKTASISSPLSSTADAALPFHEHFLPEELSLADELQLGSHEEIERYRSYSMSEQGDLPVPAKDGNEHMKLEEEKDEEKIIHLLERTGPASEGWQASVNGFISLSDKSSKRAKQNKAHTKSEQGTSNEEKVVHEMSEISDTSDKKIR
ncbi:uncharacterized protein EI97DRAFT_467677 [Westerdykella ornata]|uniref:Uncharacterized protein n=1 Tax=Westerdykella ornata TaxID=318751 RepID=A0A6A6JH38_WESOR|nr:uncharacterized protein EI97DRAFT_467677 [Westerdykella ornata]KAF2275970.1 hypothetical protein EI97DRAFT_467677 [Westerdykella ornata]